jgi:hypothetical protein
VDPTIFTRAVLLTTWIVLALVLLLLIVLYNVYPDQTMEGWVQRCGSCITWRFESCHVQRYLSAGADGVVQFMSVADFQQICAGMICAERLSLLASKQQENSDHDCTVEDSLQCTV